MSSLPHSPARIHRLVAAHLALSEDELRERVAELERERESYQELLRHALDQLHDLAGRERVRQRRLYALIEENRKLRGSAPPRRAA